MHQWLWSIKCIVYEAGRSKVCVNVIHFTWTYSDSVLMLSYLAYTYNSMY